MINQTQLVAILSFFINVMLIFAINSLLGSSLRPIRVILAAAIGGAYSGACLLSAFSFLGSVPWRLVSLMIIGVAAFGIQKTALYATAAFSLVSLAMSSLASGLANDSLWSVFLAMGSILLPFYIGFIRQKITGTYIPVELRYADKQCSITALRDTGNTLKDPITGRSVMVVSAEIARELTGLTAEQLKKPIEAMGQNPMPGLRLIPYRTVGQPAGMLLALRIPQMRIGAWQGSGLVAFAPEALSPEGRFQALTGGCI